MTHNENTPVTVFNISSAKANCISDYDDIEKSVDLITSPNDLPLDEMHQVGDDYSQNFHTRNGRNLRKFNLTDLSGDFYTPRETILSQNSIMKHNDYGSA